MGRKQRGLRKLLHFCLAVLMVTHAGCIQHQHSPEPVQEQPVSLLEQTRILIRQGSFDQALAEARHILASSLHAPPGDEALFSIGLLYADAANPDRSYEQALVSFQTLAERFPQSPMVQEACTWIDLLKRELAFENSGTVYLERMRRLALDGDFKRAIQESREVLSNNPETPLAEAALFAMGILFTDATNPQQNYVKGLEAFRRLVKDFPQSSLTGEGKTWVRLLEGAMSADRKRNASLARTRALLREGKFGQAVKENEQILARHPNSTPGDAALFGMGLAYVHPANPEKDYNRAKKLFQQLESTFPNSPIREESLAWTALLERMEQVARVDIEIEKKIKTLRE